jgi:hypothetical protein
MKQYLEFKCECGRKHKVVAILLGSSMKVKQLK